MIANKKMLMIVTIIATIILIIFSIFTIKHEIDYSKYPKVEATIVNVRSKSGTGTNSNSRTHYVSYQYNIDGKNYIIEKQVFTQTGKNIGKTEMLRYNTLNPSEIEDTLKQNTNKAICIFLIVFNLISYYLLFKKLKSEVKEKLWRIDLKKNSCKKQ